MDMVKTAQQQLREKIMEALGRAVSAGDLSQEPVPGFIIEVPANRQNGDFSSNVAMASARAFKKAPRQIAEAILSHIDLAGTYFDRCEVAGPGFMNFFLGPAFYAAVVTGVLDEGEKVFLIVIDNFRLDQWRVLAEEIGDMFDIDEQTYVSILPTATQYARNAIFSGLMPVEIASMFPELWVDEDEEEGKNLNEGPLIRTQLERFRRRDTFSYHKINDSAGAEKFLQKFNSLSNNDLNVLVINFIDMLSHARTESKMVRELAGDEAAYRSITLSWFRHSVLSELFRLLAQGGYTVLLTTDHGSIRASKPVKIIGDRNTNTNLRYKLGKNLNYNPKEVFAIKEPRRAMLPAPNISTSYVFATGDAFFAYPNNYNYYVSYYKDTFQHGGISMEEMLVPLVTMRARKR